MVAVFSETWSLANSAFSSASDFRKLIQLCAKKSQLKRITPESRNIFFLRPFMKNYFFLGGCGLSLGGWGGLLSLGCCGGLLSLFCCEEPGLLCLFFLSALSSVVLLIEVFYLYNPFN